MFSTIGWASPPPPYRYEKVLKETQPRSPEKPATSYNTETHPARSSPRMDIDFKKTPLFDIKSYEWKADSPHYGRSSRSANSPAQVGKKENLKIWVAEIRCI